MTTVSIDFRRTSPLQGKAIWLDEASVTGTEQGIMAAVIAQGETVMSNVASEPHVQDLCNFLILHGAQIKGVGTNQLVINGVEKLISCGKPFRLGNDFMEEGSLIVAGFATRGNIILEGCDLSQHHMMRLMFQKLGYELDEYVGSLRVNGQNLGVVKTEADGAMPVVKSAVWPGFNTDLLPALVTLATQANGKVMFHETLFDNRFIWTENLRRMGGDITMCDPHRVIVQGHTVLRPAPGGIQSPDIRAGMALLIACLATPGMHTVDNIYQIDRGYENIDARLNELGARIERIEK
jgi:UDP-N-acetylglucosamine 1-carboxyvinyltransferase